MKRKAAVLVAEDEPQARESLRQLLTDEGYGVECVDNGVDALRVLSAGAVEAALLDIRMPGKDGLAVLRELRELDDAPAVLVMTAFGTSSFAIEAMALGAFDYLTKPLNFDELLIQLERAIENRRRIRELEGFRREETAAMGVDIIGNSPPMQELYKLIGQVSAADSTVLIRGESGTGKELVARAIHRHSARSPRRLVTVNCASIPETLLEAELFGHERGAFTGATQRRVGKFEYAEGGAIFLDEIGELAAPLQAKLLRVLQDRVIERLGANISIALDVRVIAATNCDLEAAVSKGKFREDLYYRLNVVTLRTPPLRERQADIPELAAFLLKRCAARLKLPEPRLSGTALDALSQADWPGNVRELEHALERALILSHGGFITAENFEGGRGADHSGNPFDQLPLEDGYHSAVSALERRLIERALNAAAGNKTRAADLLKINRRLLYDKLKEFGIE
jgi:DNA-binding NtrC family response regulator